MENENLIKPQNKFVQTLAKIGRSFRNETFLYIVRRLLSSLLTIVLLAALVTTMLRLLPDYKFYDGQVYDKLAGTSGIEVANRWLGSQLYQYGITDAAGNRLPIIVSIWNFLYNILPFYKKIPIVWSTSTYEPIKYWEGFVYLGRSLSMQNKYIVDLVGERMGISFTISIITVSLAYLAGIPLGVAMAKKPGGTVDKAGNVFIVLNYAIPAIVFYLIMNRVFGIISPTGFGYYYDEKSPFLTLIPPIFCIWFLSIPGVSIWIRRFMADELNSDYVKFARSKGLPEKTIMYKHIFRNAIVPLVRNIPGTLLGAFIGSYFIEYIWKIPGTGILLVTALQGKKPDVPMIQGLTVLYGAISMISFLLGDIITVFFDPRIKLKSK